MNRALLPILSCLALSSCRSFEFWDVEVVDQSFDERTRATHVTLQFEVKQGDLPVQGLDQDSIVIYEDGVKATSESFAATVPEIIRLPVTLLIDTSYSMYRTDSIGAIKSAASQFVEALTSDGYTVDVLGFASTVAQLASVDRIPDDFDSMPADQRWTSLYLAVKTALELRSDNIIVLFSDGADNYSQNMGVGGLEEIERMIEEGGRQVHVIGYGDVRDEYDRNGIPGLRALRRIAKYGTCQFAEDEGNFDDVFTFIAGRMRTIYTYEYFSPSLSGTHELVIEARQGSRSGRSGPIVITVGEEPAGDGGP